MNIITPVSILFRDRYHSTLADDDTLAKLLNDSKCLYVYIHIYIHVSSSCVSPFLFHSLAIQQQRACVQRARPRGVFIHVYVYVINI